MPTQQRGDRPRPERRSLRSLVLFVVVVVATLPVAIVALLQTIGEAREESLARAARTATSELTEALDRGEDARSATTRVAGAHRVRARVLLLRDEQTASDVDRDERVAMYGGVASIPLDTDDPARARRARSPFDEPAVRAAREGRSTSACTHEAGGSLLVCDSAARTADGARVVYCVRSARSDAQRLAATRRPLAVLTGFVLVSGLALAWWLIARIARPLDALRAALAKRAGDARTATEPIEIAAPREVSEVVTAHNRVLAALRDERVEREKLATELVHEIKSPMAAIRMAVEQLDQGPADHAAASHAMAAIKRVDRTVAMLLELSRAEAGLDREPRESRSLRAIVDEAKSAVVEREGVTVTVRGEAIAAVAEQSVRRAMQCLIENAVSFANSAVEVEVRDEEGGAKIVVRDDGAGIEAAHVPRVFERFFSARRERGGTGIGLALVLAVARAHGGSASVESTPGRGATFTVVFPR